MNEFFHHYAELMTDPAHMAVEATFILLIDGLLLGLLVPLTRKYVKAKVAREHAVLDREHGISHAREIETRANVRVIKPAADPLDESIDRHPAGRAL